jgi:hypothetical protein
MLLEELSDSNGFAALVSMEAPGLPMGRHGVVG